MEDADLSVQEEVEINLKLEEFHRIEAGSLSEKDWLEWNELTNRLEEIQRTRETLEQFGEYSGELQEGEGHGLFY